MRDLFLHLAVANPICSRYLAEPSAPNAQIVNQDLLEKEKEESLACFVYLRTVFDCSSRRHRSRLDSI